MALRFRVPSDPTAIDARGNDLASCDGSRLLTQELRRYCEGTLHGRSFLVTGLRGAGKTWLVEGAIEQIVRRSRQGHSPRMRPLRVSLLGPQLFDVLRDAPAQNDRAAQKRIFRNLLEKVVMGLHAALAQECVRCFRSVAHKAQSQRLHELAATLEITLPEGPSPAVMRDFWRQVGALEGGVLFPQRALAGAGMRELAALSGLGYGYKRVAGKVKANYGLKTTDTATTEHDTKDWETRLGESIKPLAALIAGTTVTTQAISNTDAFSAAALGLATVLVAGLAFRFTSKGSFTQEETRDLTFLPDTSAATLDRVLPELITRLLNAGLAPVIVIDELDKVDDLWGTLQRYELLDHFKKLFAERVFTCFIGNRDFYEKLLLEEARDPYSRAHSYFTHRVFISYEAAEMHAYLDRLIEPVRS